MSSLPHPIEREEVMAYLDGELSPDDAARVAAHVRQCGGCAAVLDDMRRKSQQMQAWEVDEPSDRLDAVVRAELSRRPADGSRWYQRPWHWRWVIAFSAGTACTAAVLFLMAGPVAPPAAAPPEKPMVQASIDEQAGNAMTRQQDDRAALYVPDVRASRTPTRPRQHATTPPEIESRGPAMGGGIIEMNVRSVRLTLTASRLEAVPAALAAMMERAGGTVDRVSSTSDAGSPRRVTASLRVPSAALDSALADVKALGTLTNETQDRKNVTSEYFNLVSRLGQTRDSEQRLRARRDQLPSTGASFDEVTAQIEEVRAQIQQFEGEELALKRQVAFVMIQLEIVGQ